MGSTGRRNTFSIATNVQVYFCDQHSPWQRRSNEDTNGLLRQYFPRGTDLSRLSQAHLNRSALRLNQRPRKTLGFEAPADRLRAVLQCPVEPAGGFRRASGEVARRS
jgi:IS30 family transposase